MGRSFSLFFACACLPAGWALAAPPQNDTDDDKEARPPYVHLVEADRPVARWSFDQADGAAELNGKPWLPAKVAGPMKLAQPGPRQAKFPLFDTENQAVTFDKPASLRYDDPGAASPLDFAKGDTITLEAWVNPAKDLGSGQQVYVVGKGRTGNAGVARDNHNWALRLAGKDGTCRISFLFRDSNNRPGKEEDWHRWTSDLGFGGGTGWHHVAVVYTFGKGASIKGYVDGRESKGTWDYGGQSDEAPLVDDDQIWIGSASDNNAGNSFVGGIDEVAIYRAALSAERIAARWQIIQPKPYLTSVPIPRDQVLVEVLEGLPDEWNWNFIPPTPSERFIQRELAIVEVPKKYNPHGVQIDRGSPFVLWATTEMNLPAGKQRLLLRSRSAARLFIDDQLIAQNPFPSGKTDGHNAWEPVESKVSPNIRPLQPGDQENVAEFDLPAGLHKLRLELFVGGKRRRPETGETSVSIAPAGSDEFWVLGFPSQPISREQTARSPRTFPLTDAGWLTYERARRDELVWINQARRREASAQYAKYWQKRHDWAREFVGQASRLPSLEDNARQAERPPHKKIDSFITDQPAALIGDHAFLRRIYLDCLGVPPTGQQVREFIADQRPDKRARLIDHLLQQPGWADNWVGYWQDVLAENPNIVNPTLNNTGPFRWWIYESLLDNKPLDRFATELILMEGSPRYGGSAGFEIASENDAPLAAKAQNISLAFLAFDMRCARCHDAPHHRFSQEDLFNLAAMLHRGEQTLPKTSTIPGDDKTHASLLVQVTLKPGQKIAPRWPFAAEFAGQLPKQFLLDPADEREELALWITSPQNPRFAPVLVNRLWQRYLGRGLVEPVDDWEEAKPEHPELLAWLARELVMHDYDQKHVARLIFNSRLYQSAATSDEAVAKTLAAPLRRRLTAEQVLDSVLAVSGKEMHVEELNIDVDGSRLDSSSISLGLPRRAWQFTSMSNERDRPSLSLPAAQTAVNVLEAFGWRASRQDPLTLREREPTVLQPAILANGALPKRAAQLSEDSVFVTMALAAKSPDEFVTLVCEQILSRPPTEAERALFVEVIAADFASRQTGAPAGPLPGWPKRDGVSWSNHLHAKTSEIRLAWQKEVEKGDPPTTRLTADWRERAEDLVWALVNSPEFVWIP
ncbi:MAG: DUF1553 domain-containing protein [Pirellulaceae bacterium]|nr:DUF1553 domain-containing protein [Pirellulaceae bacterium]